MGKQISGKLTMIEHEGKIIRSIAFPADELTEAVLRDGKRGNLIQRIGAFFRKDRMEKTADAPDEQSTDTGSVGVTQGGFTSLHYYERIRLENKRNSRYRDYLRMNAESVLLRRALNVTKNNTFMSREGDEDSFIIKSDNAKVQSVLDDMAKRVALHEMAPKSYRSALMYGDSFEELVFDPAQALIRIKWLNPGYMRRNEDDFGRLMPDDAFTMVDAGGEAVAEFAHWQVVHQRHEHERGDLYGTSFFYSGRRPFRILQSMEDGVAINRLQNATDRLVFYVPVPKNIRPEDMKQFIDEVKTQFKRRINVDANGKVDLTKSPLGDDEDIFVGTWEGSPAKVERLASSGIIGQLTDLEYFQNEMVMSTGVPKSYLGLERDVNCLSLETPIPCLDGQTRTLDQIVKGYEKTGDLPWVYSWDKASGKIVPGEVEWAGVTRKDAEVVEVKLDDGSTHVCTPDHRWFLLDGTEVEAKDLTTGQQLLPLRRGIRTSKSYNGYEKVYDPHGGVELTHRRVAETLMLDEINACDTANVHHKQIACEYCGDEFVDKRSVHRRFCSRSCAITANNKKRAGLMPLPNHRVVSVITLRATQDTGDITVKAHSNFFIADATNGGVLVHNSKATLSWQDIEFGRSVRSNQREAAWFVRQVCDRQLGALGLLTEEEIYEVIFPSISFIDEEMRATIMNLKWTVAALAKTSMGVPTDWLLEKIIGLPEDDVTAILANLKEPVDPAAASVAGVPTAKPGNRELKRVKEAVMGDYRTMQHLGNLRDQLDVVISNQLNQKLAA